MSFVIAAPEMMTAAATDVATIGSNLSAAHTAAAARTLAVMPAAADEVSTSIAHLFSGYGQEYQALAGRAAAFEEQFVQHLTASAGSFAHAEAANTSLLQPLTASAASIGSIEADIASLLQSPVNAVNTILTALYNQFGVANVVFVLALLELPILIPFLLLTSPIWLPLLIVVGPFLAVLAAA